MATDALVEHCRELFAPLGNVRVRRMFGGNGFYVDDLFVALIAQGRLYLKADDTTRARFEAACCEPFAYTAGDGRRVVMGYWTVPADALESPPAMAPWGRLAIAAAVAARPAVKPRATGKAPASAAKTKPRR